MIAGEWAGSLTFALRLSAKISQVPNAFTLNVPRGLSAASMRRERSVFKQSSSQFALNILPGTVLLLRNQLSHSI